MATRRMAATYRDSIIGFYVQDVLTAGFDEVTDFVFLAIEP